MITATSSRPFTDFTKENLETMMRFKWRWLASKLDSNNQPYLEERKSGGEPPKFVKEHDIG